MKNKHLDLFISECDTSKSLQLEVAKYIHKHGLSEDEALQLIQDIINLTKDYKPHYMKISGVPCPKCGKLYFGLPVCSGCGWKDEAFDEWRNEQLEIAKEFGGFLNEGLNNEGGMENG